MSLKKIVGLLAGFALAVGLIGAGVSASFSDSVSAVQNINVGTFGCAITSTTAGTITDAHDLVYNASPIMSSAAANSLFSFTVTNTGSIATHLTISSVVTQLAGHTEFSDALVNPGGQNVAGSGTYTYTNAGLAWTELSNANRGEGVSIAYTVSCNEVPEVPAA